MAEVRKKAVDDKNDLEKLVKKTKSKKVKKVQKEVAIKKQEKSTMSKKSLLDRFRAFCHGVKGEFHKVHWPSKENMLKYSIATIFFIIFCACFFYLIGVIFAFIKSLFN